jgi:hypothetical protein
LRTARRKNGRGGGCDLDHDVSIQTSFAEKPCGAFELDDDHAATTTRAGMRRRGRFDFAAIIDAAVLDWLNGWGE